VLALLLDVKGAFDRVNKTQLLKRVIQTSIVGYLLRWVNSFLSDRRAILTIDGRTAHTRAIQAGLPQGSSVSPVLFILSISALFQWLEARHSALQAMSFVDDINLMVECDELEDRVTQLQCLAKDTMQRGFDNKVEF
jgi:retron-type reverse transcriptase